MTKTQTFLLLFFLLAIIWAPYFLDWYSLSSAIGTTIASFVGGYFGEKYLASKKKQE